MKAGELLVIRNNPLAISVTSSALFNPTATLWLQLDSSWTSSINFGANVVPNLAGTLDLDLASGADALDLLGTTFQLFNWNGMLPVGTQFNAITTAPDLVWNTSHLYTDGKVTLVAVAEPMEISCFVASCFVCVRHRRPRALKNS
jgi:hypothetical protein